MKKVININFHGRVIPIEETAFDILKQYIDSLRKYFVNEEGRDEIINDIEGRIGELFTEKLKGGTPCITDADVLHVIAGMGRPEDFDAQEGESTAAKTQTASSAQQASYQPASNRGSLYRNADDKVLGGVCSGLAIYLGIDPVVMRIIFVLLGGVVFWVYILLWIIVPSKSIQSHITKRLYRNPEQKVIAGVAGGIAAYFHVDVWIPRLIFALPFLIGLISGGFNAWWHWDFGFTPRMISGSFGWTMFTAYVILWIALPKASSSSEKLEMRGEKVDLNSIANTVKEDLEQFRGKAGKFGAEVKDTAMKFSQQAYSETGAMVRKTSSGLGNVIVILMKALLIFSFGVIALVLFGVFIALMVGGMALAPLKGFILDGTLENILMWLTIVLVFAIPLVALVTWSIRRLMGVHTRNRPLGYSFLSLWILGLISAFILFYMLGRNFRINGRLEEEQITTVSARSGQKLLIDAEETDWKKYDADFFGLDIDGDFPFHTKGDDSVLLNTVRINMVKSTDSAFHIYRIRASRGRTREAAAATAEKIVFDPVIRNDSVVVFPKGFFISKNEKFRNQRVWIVIEVPAGKRIGFGKNLSAYTWMDFGVKSNRFGNDNEWDVRSHMHWPEPGKEYYMQEDGNPKVVESVKTNTSEMAI